jgi:hypothetical protein
MFVSLYRGIASNTPSLPPTQKHTLSSLLLSRARAPSAPHALLVFPAPLQWADLARQLLDLAPSTRALARAGLLDTQPCALLCRARVGHASFCDLVSETEAAPDAALVDVPADLLRPVSPLPSAWELRAFHSLLAPAKRSAVLAATALVFPVLARDTDAPLGSLVEAVRANAQDVVLTGTVVATGEWRGEFWPALKSRMGRTVVRGGSIEG